MQSRHLIAVMLLALFAMPVPELWAQSVEFFESRVRPLLVEHCQGCHGSKKQEAGLRLDSAAHLKKGSDSGAVIEPGQPDQSSLITAIRYDGDIRMPPKGKLPAEAIAVLTEWVKQGAAWPAEPMSTATAARPSIDEVRRTHWAFQPVSDPPLPAVKQKAWVASPIDAFILARLEGAAITPSPPADRRTLIRRATFDLHGLPPTPAEVAAFEADSSPKAFEQIIDRLLASPRYGERWGRHWLDVARYADTKGYVRLKDNPRYAASWTYRDYVIRSFNDDLPYDQFVLQQLAADRLDLGDDPRPLAALGFLTLGQRFLNSQHDIIDDRIDVAMRGLQGLTVTCARCHDHKFDPVPTRDYYSLHGVFASSLEPRVLPLILRPGEQHQYTDYLRELQARTDKLDQFLKDQHTRLTASFRDRTGEYLFAAQHETVQANFLAVMFLIDSRKDLNPVVIQRWCRLLEQTRKQPDRVLGPWHQLAALKPDEFATRSREIIVAWQAASTAGESHNRLVVDALATASLSSLTDVGTVYGTLFKAADERWQQRLVQQPNARQLDDPEWDELRQLLYGPDAPPAIAFDDVEELFFVDATLQNQLHDQQRLVEDWIASPGAAPHAAALFDAPTPITPRVFLRGNASNPGESVPRRYLEVLSSSERPPFPDGSGREDFARAIADLKNPLTARVLVNRVWLHHFGAGLVRTPSDFGLRGEPPSHPELLDHLASQFFRDGQSIKSLHRRIMLSSTYQQGSANPQATTVDPENIWLGRTNRRRLDWESLRDSLLIMAGSLDLTMGGPSVPLMTAPFSTRRTVYGLIDRQNLPSEFRAFDFAPPDASNPQRHQTTVPQQALFLLNSPFLKEQAQRVATRPEIAGIESREERINSLHRLLYGRAATSDEIIEGVAFVGSDAAWNEYVQVLLLANEFVFVD